MASPDPSLAHGMREAPELREDYLVTVLTDLVSAKSVNPGTYEKQAARRVGRWLKGICDITEVEFMPGRPSLAAVLKGGGPGPRLVLNGHLDTVPVDDISLWSSDPFQPEVRDGFLYGRGACDMKGGLAAQIAVAHALARERDRLRGSLVLHFAAGEECAEAGTSSLLKAGFVGDVGIVTEPTNLNVATAERGLVFLRIRIKGRSIHASQARLGVNPIPRLQAVLRTIQRYEDDVSRRRHPLLPAASCTPTVIRAGVKENAVPDYCDVIVDRRLLPGESPGGELETLRSRLAALRADDPQFDFEISLHGNVFEPAEIDQSSDLALRMVNAVETVTGGPCRIVGTPFASDVRNLVNDAGMEAITFGPGDPAECHCADERVAILQVCAAAQALAVFANGLLGSRT